MEELTAECECVRRFVSYVCIYIATACSVMHGVTANESVLQFRFQAQTAPWALPWKPSLSLRFSKEDSRAILDAGKHEGEKDISRSRHAALSGVIVSVRTP